MSKLSSYQQNKLRETILKHNLIDAGQIILASAVECWSLTLSEPEDFSTVGNCRIGGDPDLPASLAWPQTDDGLYLNFIMQINLAELPPLFDHPLPNHGMLYFFVESDESCTDVKSKLLFHDGDSSFLSRVTSPDYDQLVHEYYVDLEPYKVVPIVTIDLPEFGSETFEMVEAVSRDTPFGTIAERYCELLESVSCADKDIHIVSKVFGHASEIEGDMRWNACLHKAGQNILICNHHKQKNEVEDLLKKALQDNEAPEIEYYRNVKESLAWYQHHKEQLQRSRHEWLQLLKIDSNRSVDLSIWYAGSFYILIREENLRRRDFSDIYVEIVAG
ncbi:MAG: DUF1963 domain-containing protein [Desulfuromonadales bacterium]|nr:DUF1963 domain-containing protein [Desulfuromonadales bacterium]